MIDPTVRRAVPGDVPALAELEQVARDALVDQRGGARWLAEHAQRGEQWIGTIDDRTVFVGVLDDLVVGYLVLDAAVPVSRVDEVFVLDAARELGFGDELLAAGLAAARSVGATVFEGEALPGDRTTKNLYERAGITARLIVVSTRLD